MARGCCARHQGSRVVTACGRHLWGAGAYYSPVLAHVAPGRYEDDLTAAKAYDKSAYYLYGANAITNFGLEACLADITEVGPLWHNQLACAKFDVKRTVFTTFVGQMLQHQKTFQIIVAFRARSVFSFHSFHIHSLSSTSYLASCNRIDSHPTPPHPNHAVPQS